MKALFYNHTGRVSGAERVLLLALAGLDRDLIQPTVVTPKGDLTREIADLAIPCLEIGELNARFTLRPDKFIRYMASLIGTVLDLRSKIVESDPDIIHANSIRAGIAALFATWGTKRPVIWHVHDELKPHPLSTAIRQLVLFSKRCRIVAVSRATAASFAGRLLRTADIVVLHNAVDLTKIDLVSSTLKIKAQLGLNNDDFVFAIVGQITPRKGQLELIKAFSRIAWKTSTAKLLIVGAPIFNDDHLYQTRLVETVKALGIEDNVIFLGHRSDAIAIIKEIDALVINSRSEAFVMVAIEAMACGTPVIATDVGGTREMIEHQHNGLLVDFGDERQLIKAISRMYADGDLRKLFKARSREKVEKHLNAECFTRKFQGILVKTTLTHASFGVKPRLQEDAYPEQMKIAIVHDYFVQRGGAEKVAEELHAMFPSSTLVTTVDIHKTPGIVTSWLRYLRITEKNHRLFFLLYPFAVETLDLTEYDLIISSSSGYAKGVRKRKDAVHICYCHTPMRWVWRFEAYAERENFGGITNLVLPPLLALLKRWDIAAARRPDYYIANSQVVADRIARAYKRDSIVISPPIDTERFTEADADGDFYLILSRLAPYKRLDLAVEACKRLGRRLVVIGDGSARKDLENIAGPETEFLGRAGDAVVAEYVGRCKALLFPGEEDFGMTPLEINAAGRPVIAYRAGGATETVIENKTGVFFDEQEPESLMSAIEDFELRTWDRDVIRNHALSFGREVFASSIVQFVEAVLSVSTAKEIVPGRVPIRQLAPTRAGADVMPAVEILEMPSH